MDENKNKLWNTAGKTGVILGGISIAYFFINQLLTQLTTSSATGGALLSILSLALWAAKFGGIIVVFRLLMKSYKEALESPSRSELAKYGRLSVLLSALFYSAFLLLYFAYINPGYADNLKTLAAQMPIPAGTEDAEAAIEKVFASFPQMMFLGNLIYCIIFGLILNGFVSRSLTSNPFEENTTEDDD